MKSFSEFEKENLQRIYDKEAEGYDSLYKTKINYVEDNIIADLLRSEISSKDFILDIGCGTGHGILLGGIKKHQYLGIDLSSGMVEFARKKFPEHSFEVCDMFKYSSEAKFSIILGIYGQVNYMGADSFCQIIKKFGQQNVKYLCVVYSNAGDDDYGYTKEHQSHYLPSEINSIFKSHFHESLVKGFSFHSIGDHYLKQKEKTWTHQLQDGYENEYKYMIVSNFESLKNDI
tara:strand:+ start:6546 stop:7238 length:693 start_codon:yes stop_codon:yes gene_type:complete